MNNNVLIFYITICYLITVIIIFEHIHLCEAILYIYRSKLYSYRPKYSLNVCALALVNYFSKKAPASHITNLTNFRGLPELIQHSRIGTELMDQNPKIYYHISAPYQGYDALSFTEEEFFKVVCERDLSYLTLHEMKMVYGARNLKIENIMKVWKEYSVPKLEGPELNFGPRPNAVNSLELGAFREEDYITLLGLDFPNASKPKIIAKDYSTVYEKLVCNPKHGRLNYGTVISEEEFDRLKHFYYLLEKNEAMALFFNNLLENNPLFPLL